MSVPAASPPPNIFLRLSGDAHTVAEVRKFLDVVASIYGENCAVYVGADPNVSEEPYIETSGD